MSAFTVNGSEPTYSQLSMPAGQPLGSVEILVSGTNEAITKLGSAFQDEGLLLPADFQYSGDNPLAAALQYQIRKGTFPAMQAIDNLIAQAEAIGGLSFAELEDMIVEATSNEATIIPTISANDFDIEEALSMLRSISWAYFEGRVYEIGIVTQHANLATHGVDLVPSFPGSVPPATDTLWITRRLETTTTGEVIESWNALLPAAAQQQIIAQPSLPIVPSPATQENLVGLSSPVLLTSGDSMEPASEAESDAEGGLDTITMPNTDQTGQPVRLAMSDLLVYPDPSTGAGLTDEEILNGHNYHPDTLKGDIILRLALTFKTTILMERINELYIAIKLPTRVNGSYTKRVTNAFHARMKELNPCDGNGEPFEYDTLRAQFDQYRNEQDIRKRPGSKSEYKNKGVKKEDWQVSKKPRRSKKRPAAETKDGGEVEAAAAPPLKCGRKSKKREVSPEEEDEA
ncbi:hypothetical protein TI39_contig490g00011 [Zymoseptoria brevis]|uniref:Uncharacterized protein n=1 Tax=Zymoseptoria brevis TaxID=1047168 RepID=A0A0F4GJN0_9PEZI|nr:hypothetical protein TI39_contig490g00011 [Zymoseptoria brevis]